MKEAVYKGLWLAGHERGVDAVMRRIVERVRQLRGDEAVVVSSPELVRFRWKSDATELTLERGQDVRRLNINAPSDGDLDDIATWNENLESFYTEVVEPIKDGTRGVSGGLGVSESPV